MSKPKVDRVKLSKMLRSGKSQAEAARIFGVSRAAINKAAKELNLNVVKSVALENAGRIVSKNLDTIDQLQKINDYANELLDTLMNWSRGDDEALQILESQVRKVRIGKGEAPETIKQYKFKDPRELALKAMQEIRGQLNLQLEIFQTLYDMRAVEEFQKEVLQVIGEIDAEVRNEIIGRLNKRRAIRAAVKWN